VRISAGGKHTWVVPEGGAEEVSALLLRANPRIEQGTMWWWADPNEAQIAA
jgi:hypothetical protein